MKGFVARTQLVSYLTREQLEKVQAREKIRGYIIPNWNIQEVFGLPTIKEKYGLPDDNEALARNNTRIEAELKNKGFMSTGEYYEGNLEWMHAFDWNVFNRSGEIIWESTGGRHGKGNLVGRLAKDEI
jgi:hypothetical protein